MRSIRRSSRTMANAQRRKFELEEASSEHNDALAALDEDLYKNHGKKCEIHMYERRYNSRGEPILLQSGSRSDLGWPMESSTEAALVLTRYYNIKKELETTQLEIKSPYIRAALKEIIRSYPGVNINSTGPILIAGDPMCLFHYREELQGYASNTRDKNAKEHVTFLLQYLSKVLSREISSYEELMQNEEAPPGLEFQNLWMAFKPGTLLYYEDEGIDALCRLKKMVKVKPFQQPEYWEFESEIIGYNGTVMSFASVKNSIKKYDGYKPLVELGVFPFSYHKNYKNLRSTILERGRKCITFVGIHHCMYEGIARHQSSNGRGGIFSMVQDRVIIDIKEYYDNNQGIGILFIPGSKVIRPDLNEDLRMSEEKLLLCVSRLPGFTLTTKKWVLLDVSKLRPVDYNKDAFASLILPNDLKKTLSSLLKVQEANSAQFDDFIEGKGRGLIVLLHGPPGTGKTFTAESIADHSQRPLYTLGKTEFGNSGIPGSGTSLSAALARASRWNSIVLLDEADVFMQERSANEMFRKEQVSVLLRILEYFEGVMILTTNRVQTIDAAFKSRIHLSLTYPPLSSSSRSGLWETFILKFTKQQRPKWLDAKFLKKVSAEEVNGREIKNIVRVGHALAVYDKRSMRAKDIIQGLQYLKDFERDFSIAAGKRKKFEAPETSLAKRIRLDNREAYNEEEQEEYEAIRYETPGETPGHDAEK